MTLLIQCACLVIVVAAIVFNRTQVGNPNLPLLLLGICGAIWFVLALYVVGAHIWILLQQPVSLDTPSSLRSYFNSGLAIVFLGAVGVFIVSSQRVPPIHDITTDTNNPPAFDYVAKLRHPKHNSLQYDKATAIQQETAYPQLQPTIIDGDIAWLRQQIPVVMESLGWQIHQQYTVENQWYWEASEKSTWLGFVDDVVLRLQPLDDGRYQLDMRSASRIGVSDFGVNAQRIQQFFQALGNVLSEH